MKAIHISDLTIKYCKTIPYGNIFSTTTTDPDTTYTNVIYSGFSQELDDVQLRVNTYNDKSVSYSFAMGKDGTDYYYIRGLNFVGEGEDVPENKIVKRMTSHYSQPKYQYANTLKNDNITPFTLVTEHNLNKTMIVKNVEYDMTDNNAAVDTIEL